LREQTVASSWAAQMTQLP